MFVDVSAAVFSVSLFPSLPRAGLVSLGAARLGIWISVEQLQGNIDTAD